MNKKQTVMFVAAAMVAGAIGSMLFAPAPAGAVAKEMMQLMDDVGSIKQSEKDLTSSLDSKYSVLKTLIEQQSDSNAKLSQEVAGLQKTVQDMQANSGAQLSTMGTQVSGVSDNLSDFQSRLSKINQQLADVQGTLQSLDAKVSALAQPPAQVIPGGPGGASASPYGSTSGTTPANQMNGTNAAPYAATPANPNGAGSAPMTNAMQPGGTTTLQPPPAAESLYNSALQDYLTKKTDLAQQEFTQYLKYYPNLDFAGNAVFYLGEIAYTAKNYSDALDHYSDVLANFPNSSKTGDALYKRGLTNLELGKRAAGINDLREVIKRFPGSSDDRFARAKLHELNVPVTAGR